MNQSNKFKFSPIKKIVDLFKNRSMSTQLIFTIVLIFASFFLLQLFLNSQFFQRYYTAEEFNDVHSELITYIDSMNQDDADLYDVMYNFTSNTNALSIVVGRDFRLTSPLYSEYTITMTDSATSTEHTFLVPDNDHNYIQNEIVEIQAYEYSLDLFSPIYINIDDSYLYSNGISCNPSDCISVEGPVLEVYKPLTLNGQYENNPLIRQELNKLSSNTIYLDDISYEEGYWYTSSSGNQDILVFIHELGLFDFVITIIPIENTSNIISIVNSYNNYVYLTAIAIIIIWSLRLTSIISKPVQNIEGVAREIADLNFNVEAHEYNNRENKSLSNSINLIAKNLKETLSTLSTKNDELTSLYDEQVKQVSLKKQLVSSISHELKTPLMIMQVTVQGILDGIIDEEDQMKELNNVLDEINKSSIMIGDMLQIYRLEDANAKLELSEFNLSEIVDFFIHDFEHILKKHHFELDLNIDKSVFIEADLKLIKRVISNFFTNAIRYTPEAGKIYFEVSQKDNLVYFELTNYGSQIDEEDLENIWIPFFRGQTTVDQKLKTKGSGVGLYLVSEILKAHDAEFGITNVDNGVKAFFTLKKQ